LDGTENNAGGGSGGGIRIDVGTLQGLGSIDANGGTGGVSGGGGGGGRVAVYYQSITTFDLSKITASGGTGDVNGGAGTIYLQGPGRESGELIVDNNDVPSSTVSTPIIPFPTGQLNLTFLRVRRGAHARVDDEISVNTLEVAFGPGFSGLTLGKRVIAQTIDLHDEGFITHLPATATEFFKVDLNAETITIDATSRIGVAGRGFLGGNQPGNLFGANGMTVGFAAGSTGRSGGSYGGLGGSSSGSSNPVYGDFRDPNEPGSGGATFGVPTGSGGGLVRIGWMGRRTMLVEGVEEG